MYTAAFCRPFLPFAGCRGIRFLSPRLPNALQSQETRSPKVRIAGGNTILATIMVGHSMSVRMLSARVDAEFRRRHIRVSTAEGVRGSTKIYKLSPLEPCDGRLCESAKLNPILVFRTMGHFPAKLKQRWRATPGRIGAAISHRSRPRGKKEPASWMNRWLKPRGAPIPLCR